MTQCNNCTDPIDEAGDTHVVVVKPMEYKGESQSIKHYYCTVNCLVERARQ